MDLFDTSAPREHARAIVLIFALVLSIAGNVVSVFWYGGKTIHYIPVTSTGEVGAMQTSRPGEFPVSIQRNVAELVVLTLGNTTSDSLMASIQTVRPYLSPATYTALHAQGTSEVSPMQTADISIMTTDLKLENVAPVGLLRRFRFSAMRRMYSYGMALDPHPVTVVVDVMPPQVGTGLASSLQVSHIAWPELKIKDGSFQDFSFTEQLINAHVPFRRGVTK